MQNNTLESVVDLKLDRRKTFLIKPGTQQSMALEVLLMAFVVVNMTVIASSFIVHNAASFHQAKEQLAFGVAIAEVLGFGVLYYFCVRSSHKVAGPLFNLERCMKKASNGQLSERMAVRDSDHFQEVGQEFNRMVDEYDQRMRAVQTLAAGLRSDSESGSCDKQRVDELIEKLAWFKTSQC